MAVTQISKIQVRRGRKNSTTGIPQLSSGEIAWAVDSQELFIGNGSVAEGAPYVGNTKILTENDNLLELLAGQQFAFTDPAITRAIPRPIQDKLDEYVSVADFGAIGDGVSDNTEAFQIALEQLFLNPVEKFRKTLVVPNGEYIFNSGDIKIPSNATIQGETRDGVILRLNGNRVRLISNGIENPADFSINSRPFNIEISNITIERGFRLDSNNNEIQGQIDFTGGVDIFVNRVRFRGDDNFEIHDFENWDNKSPAIFWANNDFSGDIKTTDIRFDSCIFESEKIAVNCSQTLTDIETNIRFEKCKFFNVDTALYVQGNNDKIQENRWTINDCEFENVSGYSFISSWGTGTYIRNSRFKNCGNDPETGLPIIPMVSFGESADNIVIDCVSDRQQRLTGSNEVAESTVFPEVENADRVSFVNRIYADLGETDNFTPLTIFSLSNNYIKLNYTIRLDTSDIRTGQMIITINDVVSTPGLTDQYTFSSTEGEATGSITGNTLTVANIAIGGLGVGSIINSGLGIRKGTKVIDLIDVDPDTGLGTYLLDGEPQTVAPVVFKFTSVRLTNLAFEARLRLDQNEVADALTLLYKNPIVPGSPGSISFDVSYGV
jgi:hypothetical protein